MFFAHKTLAGLILWQRKLLQVTSGAGTIHSYVAARLATLSNIAQQNAA